MDKPKLPKFATRLQTWLIVMGTITATYAGAAAIGFDVPRPVWIAEHLHLVGEVKQNTVRALKSDVTHIRRQLIDARVAKSKAKPGTPLYDEFFKDEEELKEQLEDAKEALSDARARK